MLSRLRMMITLSTTLAFLLLPFANAGPRYDQDRRQLESVMADLKAWLPGAWDSFPQIWYEHNVTMPAAGEHPHWHRSFALIDAPQVGETVFYGQINLGGRDGPILGRSQVLYKAVIDAEQGVVAITGQPIGDPYLYRNLHERPELWSKVSMPDESAVRCSFIWRRHGRQLVGVLDSKSPEGRSNGPGTCSYIAGGGKEFVADAEWVLSPEELWLYDINLMGGVQFVGRSDRTHTRLYRTAPYTCATDSGAEAAAPGVTGHDRGFTATFADAEGSAVTMQLLRAWYPNDAAPGITDELRLTLTDSDGSVLGAARAKPGADAINVETAGISVQCSRSAILAPLALETL